METALLQARVRQAATEMGGTPWPNALGFDAHGWSYALHDSGTWHASWTRETSLTYRYGFGPSPIDAKARAMREPAKEKG